MFRNKTKSTLLGCLSLLFFLFGNGGAQKCDCDTLDKILSTLSEMQDSNMDLIDTLLLLEPYGPPKSKEHSQHPKKIQYDSCKQALEEAGKSDVYKIYLASAKKYYPFYCCKNPSTGSSWMSIMNRKSNSKTDFFRTWDDYVKGFGNPSHDFWVGLNKLSMLTENSDQSLWIRMQDFDDNVTNVYYGKFKVGNEDTFYELTIDSPKGNAGDSLTHLNKAKFSTRDKDNDGIGKNCAINCKGGWWYRGENCGPSNLNGVWFDNPIIEKKKSCQGIIWSSWRGKEYSLKSVSMYITNNEEYHEQ